MLCALYLQLLASRVLLDRGRELNHPQCKYWAPLLRGWLLKSENGIFPELEYEMVENLLSLCMCRVQIPFQECMSWFQANIIYSAELGYNSNARCPLVI